MKTNREKAKFALDTLMVYRNDFSKLGYGADGCVYLTEDGKKCALGMHMKEGPWQYHPSCVSELSSELTNGKYEGVSTLDDILTEEAAEMDLSPGQWKAIQNYHDGLTTTLQDKFINRVRVNVDRLDSMFGTLGFFEDLVIAEKEIEDYVL